jgi:hypothetical protein
MTKKTYKIYIYISRGSWTEFIYIYANIICDIPEKKMTCHQILGPVDNTPVIINSSTPVPPQNWKDWQEWICISFTKSHDLSTME